MGSKTGKSKKNRGITFNVPFFLSNGERIEKIRQGYISKHNSELNYYVELHQSTIMIAFV